MRVRAFVESDAPALARIFFTAIQEIASAHYTDEQIRAWAPVLPSPERFRARANDGRTTLVAVDDANEAIAYGDCEPDGHIDHLFCLPSHSRKGVTGAVYQELERGARRAGISRLYVEASEPARRFFEKHGFVVERRNDFAVKNVPIYNWSMVKDISSTSHRLAGTAW
jgi:putative acetyltransferase